MEITPDDDISSNDGLTKKDTVGFIMLRHVNSISTDRYWKLCYDCIRKYYPENEIVIIDDNSKPSYLTNKELYKTLIIDSPYPKRGELLPYLYYSYNKPFDIAFIIHDSVFINSYIDPYVKEFSTLWNFQHRWDQPEDEIRMISLLANNRPELIQFYKDHNLWKGIFGGMTIIRQEYLAKVNEKYNFDLLIGCVLTRYNRSSFERALACLLQIEKTDKQITSIFGDIHQYIPWGLTFDQKHHFTHLPIIKVWTGR
jgi:hypothetical protein